MVHGTILYSHQLIKGIYPASILCIQNNILKYSSQTKWSDCLHFRFRKHWNYLKLTFCQMQEKLPEHQPINHITWGAYILNTSYLRLIFSEEIDGHVTCSWNKQHIIRNVIWTRSTLCRFITWSKRHSNKILLWHLSHSNIPKFTSIEILSPQKENYRDSAREILSAFICIEFMYEKRHGEILNKMPDSFCERKKQWIISLYMQPWWCIRLYFTSDIWTYMYQSESPWIV